MSFTPDMPFSGQSLGNSRLQVLNNFKNYYDTIALNHVAPNTSGQGKHTFVEMPVQGSTPSTLAGEGGLFTKALSSDPTKSILYYQRDANVATNQPVLPMAVCAFITRNTNGMCTLVAGYNVTSVERTTTGTYRVTLGITLPYVAGTTEYAVIVSPGPPSSAASIPYYTINSGSQFIIQTLNGGGTLTDPATRMSFSVIQ
jgi:hypothetical protein